MNRGKIAQWCGLGVLFLILFSQTVQVQWILRQIVGSRTVYEKIEVSPTSAAANKPSSSDIEAAENARKALIDTERVEKRKAEQAASTPHVVTLDLSDPSLLQKPQTIVIPSAMPPEFDESTPQVVVETRLLRCEPSKIAPNGFLAEQGWRFIPPAMDQKEPVRPRLADLTLEESPHLAAGVFQCDEYYLPALFRFFDDSQFGVILSECQSDSRANVLQAPKVTMISGQPGTVFDTTESFTVSVNSVVDPDANTYMDRYDQGTLLNLLPEVQDDGSVQMKRFTFQFRSVISHETFELVPGEEEPVLVCPKIKSWIFHFPVTIPRGKTLVVAMPYENRIENETPDDYFGLPPMQKRKIKGNVLCLAVSADVITEETTAETQ